MPVAAVIPRRYEDPGSGAGTPRFSSRHDGGGQKKQMILLRGVSLTRPGGDFGYPSAKSGAVWQFWHPSSCRCWWLQGTSPRSGGEYCQKRAAAPKFGVGGERLLAPRVFTGMGMLRISHPEMRRRVRPPTPELPPERRMLCKKKKRNHR